MALFVNDQQTTDKEVERLFSAGVLLLLGKAYSDAYSCFDRIHEEYFAVMYNKALCCFMVKWYDECYRLLCEAERLLHGMDIACETQLPEAFLRYDYDEAFPFYPNSARYSRIWSIQTIASVESGNSFPAAFI